MQPQPEWQRYYQGAQQPAPGPCAWYEGQRATDSGMGLLLGLVLGVVLMAWLHRK